MTRSSLSVSALIMLGGASVASAGLGGQLYGTGGMVSVEILGGDAGYTSELWMTSPSLQYVGTNRDVGLTLDLGVFPANDEIIFGIRVQETGNWFYTGPASRNPDGIEHNWTDMLPDGPNGEERVYNGFEDIFGGGDFDYNDNQWIFSGVIPAPATAPMLAIAGLALTRRRR